MRALPKPAAPPCGRALQVASAPAAPGARASGLSCLCGSCFVCRLVSANSIEEKLLKNGTKDLIREVAAQGNDYSMAFLTQVPRLWGHRRASTWHRVRGSGDPSEACSAVPRQHA